MRESKIEGELKKAVIIKGGVSWKFICQEMNGATDQLCIIPTARPQKHYFKIGWVEVKQWKKQRRRHQKIFRNILLDLNQSVHLLDDINQIPCILENL